MTDQDSQAEQQIALTTNDDADSSGRVTQDLEVGKDTIDETVGVAAKDFDEEDDVFSVDLNEDCWCPKLDYCDGKCKFSLTAATIVAAVLGAVIGIIIQSAKKGELIPEDWITLLGFPGKLWIRALKLLVLPLVALMMLILPSRVERVGRIGRTALPFFFLTSTLAAIQGTIWVNIIQPGKHGNQPPIPPKATSGQAQLSELDTVLAIFENAVADNIVSAMASLKVLGVICFFLVYGLLLRQVNKDDSSIVIKASKALLKCTMIAVAFVVWLTPVGMLSMVLVKIVGTEDFFGLLRALGMYCVTALIGHLIHVLLVLPLIVFFVARANPWVHLLRILPAPLTAFATSSSAATLPRSIEVAEKAGVSRSVYQFVLPLGAAINMDGTAQGFPIMIMFIAQLYGRSISAGQQFSVMLLAIVISIGTAPVPNAGMVYLIMLLSASDMDDIAEIAIATLFILDWFIDRVETAVNVTSDQYITKMVDAIEERREKKGINDIKSDSKGM